MEIRHGAFVHLLRDFVFFFNVKTLISIGILSNVKITYQAAEGEESNLEEMRDKLNVIYFTKM